jgi:iron complex transport system ATP-binding protein
MTPAPHPLLRAQDLSVRLGTREVVHALNLELARGELVTLAGPNGAGKTTLLRAVAGLVASEGQAFIDGGALEQFTLRERARLIAYLPQGHVFHWPLLAAEVVALGRHPHGDPFGRPSAADKAAVARALTAVAATAFAERPIGTLSGGERARIALARALATEAPLLLADEPTASLDLHHQLVIMQRLREVARQGGGVLAVMHDLALAARFSDRIMVMNEGAIVASGPPREALSPEILAGVFGVEADLLEIDGAYVPIARRTLPQADLRLRPE